MAKDNDNKILGAKKSIVNASVNSARIPRTGMCVKEFFIFSTFPILVVS